MKKILVCIVAILCCAGSLAYAQPAILYKVHIKDKGWQDGWTMDGKTAGTVGEARQLEAVQIKLQSLKGNLRYQVYVPSDHYWTDWKKDTEEAGTTNQGKAISALRIELKNAGGYGVKYRAHISGSGWSEWISNGQTVGSERGYQLEAIEVALVPPPPAKKPIPKK